VEQGERRGWGKRGITPLSYDNEGLGMSDRHSENICQWWPRVPKIFQVFWSAAPQGWKTRKFFCAGLRFLSWRESDCTGRCSSEDSQSDKNKTQGRQ